MSCVAVRFRRMANRNGNCTIIVVYVRSSVYYKRDQPLTYFCTMSHPIAMQRFSEVRAPLWMAPRHTHTHLKARTDSTFARCSLDRMAPRTGLLSRVTRQHTTTLHGRAGKWNRSRRVWSVTYNVARRWENCKRCQHNCNWIIFTLMGKLL